MSSSPSMQIADPKSVTQGVIPPDATRRSEVVGGNLAASPQIGPKRVGYGLPCAKCKTYYAANLSSCPVCKHGERVSPTAFASPGSSPIAPTGDAVALEPEDVALEEEREKFLREFKSQIYAAHTQINAAASFRCSKEENHQGEFEPAAVCQGCYDHVRERVDLMEAAMHMEIKEAAQIIYDAVWSDPSDPSKTYQNAGQALLTQLRKRAGISTVMGSNQPLSH